MIQLNDWSLDVSILHQTQQEDRFAVSLVGKVIGHPSRPDGQVVTTSPVIALEKRVATTHSGSRYLLGEPSDRYIELCRSNGLPIPTEEQPFPFQGENNEQSH